ncbi:MAG: guanylate kinase [Dehalococcoidia bacterium]|nr:guanylate kinase [Dehalococcoidia bacterium]
MKLNSKIFLISGPSGVGKDTIILELRKIFPDFHFVITTVTRHPREDEIEGINHFFVSEPEFLELVEKDKLIEWSRVYGNYYGVPKSQILEPSQNNKHVLLRVDVQGAKKIKESIPEVILIFIKPDSVNSVKKHLLERGQVSDEQIKIRLDTMKSEIELSNYFDYVITNIEGNIDLVVSEVKDIIDRNI